MAGLPWQQHLALREAFTDLRNKIAVMFWAGGVLSFLGIVVAGGKGEDEVRDLFYLALFLIPAFGTLALFLA